MAGMVRVTARTHSPLNRVMRLAKNTAVVKKAPASMSPILKFLPSPVALQTHVTWAKRFSMTMLHRKCDQKNVWRV